MKGWRGGVLVLLVLLVLLQVCFAKNYSVVLVGGHLADDNEEVWGKILELGGGTEARFGVVTAASEDPCCDEDSSWVYYRDLLESYGAAEVYYIPITEKYPEKNSDPSVVEHIKTLTGFFFGGGDQTRLIKAFYNGLDNSTAGAMVASPALLAIRSALYSSGGVVAGTSAGTDIQTASVMITGGESYMSLVDGANVYWTPITQPNINILTGYAPGGFSFFPYGLVDTHFENRGRHGRLIRLMADTVEYPHGSLYSFGIDENTALVVTGAWRSLPDGSEDGRIGEVIGEKGITLFDMSMIEEVDNVSNNWKMFGLRVSHMTRGDKISLEDYAISPAAFKTSLEGKESRLHASKSYDIFKEDAFEFNRIAVSLFDNKKDDRTVGYTAESDPKYALEMHKGPKKLGNNGGFGGVDPVSGEYVVSYSNMVVNIHTFP